MKKLFTLFGAALLAFAVVSCGDAKAKKTKIGVSIPAADHGWTGGVIYSAEAAKQKLEAANPDYEIIISTARDAAEQVNKIENLLVQGVRAVVVLPQEPGPLTSVCEAAKKQGAFLVTVDRGLDKPIQDVYVAGDNAGFGRTAAQALITMFEAAKADGVTGWQISAGYRSVKYQQKLFDRQVAEYQNQGLSVAKAKSAASKLVADPGASEHHTGLAFDITVAGTTFKGTEQQKWLQKHCWDYGFIIRYPKDGTAETGYAYEPWHIRYVGPEHAEAIAASGLPFETYLSGWKLELYDYLLHHATN